MKLLLWIMIVFFGSVASAQQRIETIQLNHRPAEEVLNQIEVFLPKDANARAFNEFIILQAQPNELKQLKQLINDVDTPIQRLKISILNTDEVLVDQDGKQIAAEISHGDHGVSSQISLQRWSTQNLSNKQHSYHVQGIAAKPMLIMIGKKIAQQQQTILFTAQGGVAVSNTPRYINIDNGFQAVARILPNHQVIVDIHPRFSDYDKRTGNINSSEIISRISGPVGSWLVLGQIDNQYAINKQGVSSYQSHRQHQQTVYIKVDPL